MRKRHNILTNASSGSWELAKQEHLAVRVHAEQCRAYPGTIQLPFQYSMMEVYKFKFELVSLQLGILSFDQASVHLNLQWQSHLSLCMVSHQGIYSVVAF